jgi:hypothetical protein
MRLRSTGRGFPHYAIGSPLLLGVFLALAGCHHYTESPPESIAPGTEVRVHLSSGESAARSEFLESHIRAVQARWEGLEASRVALSVPGDEVREGLQTRILRQRIVLEREEVSRVEVRSLDRTRTAVVVAALGVGLGWFVYSNFQVEEPGSPRPPPPNGEL